MSRAPKYKAIRTEVDGIVFASKKEAKRYGELKLLERGKVISGLQLQPKFDINVMGESICKYVADFKYVLHDRNGQSQSVVEDVKGMKTPVYILKKKLVEAIYKIQIKEV